MPSSSSLPLASLTLSHLKPYGCITRIQAESTHSLSLGDKGKKKQQLQLPIEIRLRMYPPVCKGSLASVWDSRRAWAGWLGVGKQQQESPFHVCTRPPGPPPVPASPKHCPACWMKSGPALPTLSHPYGPRGLSCLRYACLLPALRLWAWPSLCPSLSPTCPHTLPQVSSSGHSRSYPPMPWSCVAPASDSGDSAHLLCSLCPFKSYCIGSLLRCFSPESDSHLCRESLFLQFFGNQLSPAPFVHSFVHLKNSVPCEKDQGYHTVLCSQSLRSDGTHRNQVISTALHRIPGMGSKHLSRKRLFNKRNSAVRKDLYL